MKKKTVIPIALILVLTLTALAGCGGQKNTVTDVLEDAAAEVATELAEAIGGESVIEDAEAVEEASKPTADEESLAQDVDFEETVIVDNENCTFKVTSINPNGDWGYTIKVFLENKTEADLMFSLSNVSVNGFMCDPFWTAEVTAGMKSNDEISFYEDDFELNGIVDVTDIEFTLSVYDYENWEEDYLVEDVFTIYPLGEEAVIEYTRVPGTNDIVLFDTEECAMVVTGTNPEGDWGYDLNVYLENKTDATLMFSLDGAAVDGFMCDPYWATTVAPGKMCNTIITWDNSDLEENGITTPQEFTMPITVYDYDNWDADNIVEDTFTVTP